MKEKGSGIKVLKLLCVMMHHEHFMFIKNKMLILMFLISQLYKFLI